jgi:UPF0755 protein
LTTPRIIKIISLILGLALVLCAIAAAFVLYVNSPPGVAPRGDPSGSLRVEDDGSVTLEVRNGESALSVGNRLEEAGIIRSRHFWRLLSRFEREFIKAGTYRLELPAGQLAIHSVLVSGKQLLHRVMVPEGVTLSRVARIFEDAGICDGAALLEVAADPETLGRYRIPGKNLEGYLFPDTYFFPQNYPPHLVIQTMADNFFARLGELAVSPEELFSRVILASIIEREYRVDDEAPLMAGVFYNRLGINMALQSCATVEYMLTEILGRPHPKVIYFRDTDIQDPYNTYMNPGLPPGPICSPGLVALNAVFNPAPSDYLYFRLIDPDAGRHYFSRTIDEHAQAAVYYIKGKPGGSTPPK